MHRPRSGFEVEDMEEQKDQIDKALGKKCLGGDAATH